MTAATDAAPAPADRRAFLRASMSVGAWTLISRASGFVRLAAIGAVLGPTFLGNLFQTANQLPNLAFELVAGQLIASLLIPALVQHLDADDREASERLAGGFLGVVLAVFGVVALALALAGPFVARLLGLGIDDAAVRDDLVRLGWPLLVVVMPQLLLYGYIGVANAVQNARHRFGLAAAAPVVENVVVIATLLAFRIRHGSGGDLAEAGIGDVLLLGVGSTVGVALHALLQGWGAHRVGVRLRPRAGWRDPEVRHIVRLAVPSLGLAGLNAAQTFGALIVVGSVAGGVVAFQMGLAFVATAVALGARPLTVAALPDLSRLAAAGDLRTFREHWDRTLAMALFLLAPAAAGLSALAPALGRLLGLGQMSGDDAVALMAAAIVGLSVAVLGEGVTSFTTQASYALRDARAPLQAALVRTLLLSAGLGLTLRLSGAGTVLFAAGVSFSLASLLSAWYLCRAIGLRLPGQGTVGLQVRRGVTLAVAAGLPALAVSLVVGRLDGLAGRIGPVAAGGLTLGVVYVALSQLMTRRYGWPSVLQRAGRADGRAADTAAGRADAPGRSVPEPATAAKPSLGLAGGAAGGSPATVGSGGRRRGRGRLAAFGGPLAIVVLLAVAVGPALSMGDLRWLAITSAVCGVGFAAARPTAAALALALLGPLLSTFDLHRGTAVTAWAALSVVTGAGLAAFVARATATHRRRIRLGVTGWSAVLAAGLTGVGAAMVGNDAETGARLAVVIIATAVAFVSALDPLRDLWTAGRYLLSSSLLAFPTYLLLQLLDAQPSSTLALVGLAAASVAAIAGLSLMSVCRRRNVSPGPAVLAGAVALGACGGWAVALPLVVSLWLVQRHWPSGSPGSPAAGPGRPHPDTTADPAPRTAALAPLD